MDFDKTGLPDKPVFRDAFRAGWVRFLDRFDGDSITAGKQYQRGPIAMARLICEHGGDCRQFAAAACLAGPAVFSAQPADTLNAKLVEFSREVQSMRTTCEKAFIGKVPRQSGDARLFLQASAILLMEELADPLTGPRYSATDAQKIYTEALELYSAARGGVDTYKLDTRFEIAAMKVTTVLESRPHIWTLNTKTSGAVRPQANIHV